MGKFKMGHNPLRPGCYLTLSTGAIADMTTDTAQEAIEAVDNLLSMIVMENFRKILKASTEDQNYDRAVEIIEKEVQHLVHSEFAANHEGGLHWILTVLALERFDFFITEVIKKQKKEQKR